MKSNYSLEDVCNILKIKWHKARRIASAISQPVKIGDTSKYQLTDRELFEIAMKTNTVENLDKFYRDGFQEEVHVEVKHPLVTDKRFLREDYFPDLKLSEDFEGI